VNTVTFGQNSFAQPVIITFACGHLLYLLFDLDIYFSSATNLFQLLIYFGCMLQFRLEFGPKFGPKFSLNKRECLFFSFRLIIKLRQIAPVPGTICKSNCAAGS